MQWKQISQQPTKSPANPRWLVIALAAIGIHQAQSMLAEPQERPFRILAFTIIGLMPLTYRLPQRLRGGLWMLLGGLPVFGAFIGHLIPIVRKQEVPPASETAPLNLAGGAFLVALGAAQAFGRIINK
ncbi:hypothetical protein KDA_44240 [Dictyobacter alpinus]|uniref:Uncharacterized protein n=1 Tax=Dictyobacter alpinus TaxID=2014873 RepID=A0A402BCB1_9CHLR|nr:hypothetical protein [Dictyobacter alpinus]GCE28940.1 hypothetical protein KDA_44240 [Dictyobacter alpinus]